jgi:predicted nuclease of restriction endonuclease-like (RecB) superfamily
MSLPIDYAQLLIDVKGRIQKAQLRAAFSANSELSRLYWQVGQLLDRRQAEEGWGAAVIPRLARDLAHELPEVKGFSERNMGLMVQFYRAYPLLLGPDGDFLQPPVAKTDGPGLLLQPLVAQLPWAHNMLLLQAVKDEATRAWYAGQTLAHGWSRNVLKMQIDTAAHQRQGAAITNFAQRLPAPQSDLARQVLKDPYLFDFLTLEAGFHERELETGLVRQVERFLLELGQGFAFVGRQYPLTVGESDFYIDLLFYHLKLRAFVVIELKRGDFKPEYAGKLNFYCNLVDDALRHAHDAPTIGLMLCQNKDSVLAEYALRGIDKPIGIASYELTRALPANLQSALPSIEAIEAELRAAGAGPAQDTE